MKKDTDFDLISKGYSKAETLANSHYENFPVISVFLPAELRKHVAIIYWFARTADDIADEGSTASDKRIADLEAMESKLADVLQNGSNDPLWAALGETIVEFNLPLSLFTDLISAFKQDIVKKRFASHKEILDYCRRSANPIGRLLLHLFRVREQEAYLLSDEICSALQLVNFYQDVTRDVLIDRVYIPVDRLEKYKIAEKDYLKGEPGSEFAKLMEELTAEAESMLREGLKILEYLPFRLRIEIGFTVAGGLEIIKKIRNIRYQVYRIRPKLSKSDYLRLFISSVRYGFIRSTSNIKRK